MTDVGTSDLLGASDRTAPTPVNAPAFVPPTPVASLSAEQAKETIAGLKPDKKFYKHLQARRYWAELHQRAYTTPQQITSVPTLFDAGGLRVHQVVG